MKRKPKPTHILREEHPRNPARQFLLQEHEVAPMLEELRALEVFMEARVPSAERTRYFVGRVAWEEMPLTGACEHVGCPAVPGCREVFK